jgi:hypothetical protein
VNCTLADFDILPNQPQSLTFEPPFKGGQERKKGAWREANQTDKRENPLLCTIGTLVVQ